MKKKANLICTCGHRLGDHDKEAPHKCLGGIRTIKHSVAITKRCQCRNFVRSDKT